VQRHFLKRGKKVRNFLQTSNRHVKNKNLWLEVWIRIQCYYSLFFQLFSKIFISRYSFSSPGQIQRMAYLDGFEELLTDMFIGSRGVSPTVSRVNPTVLASSGYSE